MGQTSRVVTIIDGVRVMEATTCDEEGDLFTTHYLVQGEKYETLQAGNESGER